MLNPGGNVRQIISEAKGGVGAAAQGAASGASQVSGGMIAQAGGIAGSVRASAGSEFSRAVSEGDKAKAYEKELRGGAPAAVPNQRPEPQGGAAQDRQERDQVPGAAQVDQGPAAQGNAGAEQGGQGNAGAQQGGQGNAGAQQGGQGNAGAQQGGQGAQPGANDAMDDGEGNPN